MNENIDEGCNFCFDGEATHELKWISRFVRDDGHILTSLLCDKCLEVESNGVRGSSREEIVSHRPL